MTFEPVTSLMRAGGGDLTIDGALAMNLLDDKNIYVEEDHRSYSMYSDENDSHRRFGKT